MDEARLQILGISRPPAYLKHLAQITDPSASLFTLLISSSAGKWNHEYYKN